MEKEIDFKTLCGLCRFNGVNHQEYGRLCPHPSHCLHPNGRDKNNERITKKQATCPVWNSLK
jgi:hypothetical protein